MVCYSNGVILLTHSSHYKEDSDRYIKFKDILQPDELQKAVFSAMCADFDWIESELPGDVPALFYLDFDKRTHPKTTKITRSWTIAYPKYPVFMTFGTMHAKLMLLYYSERLRIVITSANLMPFDYDQVENIVFIQDFPMAKNRNLEASSSSKFVQKLANFLSGFPHLSVEWDVYDWSKAVVQPIISIPGYFQSSSVGISQLSECFLPFKEQIAVLEIQATSFGGVSLNSWLQETLPSLCNISSTTIKFVFPSLAYASTSRFGREGFTTIFLKMKDFNGSYFLHQNMYNCHSKREGSAMHSKIIAAYDLRGELLCFYCGSHNFSRSAWGFKTRSTNKLCISNYELGIFGTPNDISFLLPYISPPSKYSPTDLPWTQG